MSADNVTPMQPQVAGAGAPNTDVPILEEALEALRKVRSSVDVLFTMIGVPNVQLDSALGLCDGSVMSLLAMALEVACKTERKVADHLLRSGASEREAQQ